MKYDVNIMSDEELKAAIKVEMKKDHLYSVRQSVKKVQLNSLYGSLGNEYSRWYDLELAEAITLSGQLHIQWIADGINKLLNRVLNSEGEDFVIASDTDSVYLRLGKFVEHSIKGEHDPNKIVDFLNNLRLCYCFCGRRGHNRQNFRRNSGDIPFCIFYITYDRRRGGFAIFNYFFLCHTILFLVFPC